MEGRVPSSGPSFWGSSTLLRTLSCQVSVEVRQYLCFMSFGHIWAGLYLQPW